MAEKQINYYAENKKTGDIVYTYNTGEEVRCKKTEQGVLYIHTDICGSKTEYMLTEGEFSLLDFDRIKTVSDDEYRSQNKGDVLEHRHTISLTALEETRICSKSSFACAEHIEIIDGDDEKDYRTLEKAMAIMDKCLSETQKRRFIMYYMNGYSLEEIAAREGVYWTSVRESVGGAKKKIEKFLGKGLKTPAKNASKLYIGEGQNNKASCDP